jgi:glutamate-1-semialdehyde 2,1-aminomutase
VLDNGWPLANEKAEQFLIGSVMSSWNHFNVSGRTVIARADDCRVWDTTGCERIDWIMGWGSLVLGHRPQTVLDAIHASFEEGFGYQYESPANVDLAELICQLVPSVEKVRLCNSGLEATQYAVRVARAVTGRRKVLKFEGHFHGLNDSLLWGVDCSPALGKRGTDGTIAPVAGSVGIPAELADLLVVVPFNNSDVVSNAFASHGGELAAVILEPVSLNIGCVYPDPEFLDQLRQLCTENGTLLIFDEVLTGFRGAAGGAQEYFAVVPDLTCLGKALGCGAPVAAVGGRTAYMEVLSPVGQLGMAGTNTARRMTVAATFAALKTMRDLDVWSTLRAYNDYFVSGCRCVFAEHGVPAYVEGFGGRIGIHIGSEERPRNYQEVVEWWNRDYHEACYRIAHEKKQLFGFLLPLSICPEPVTLSVAHDQAVLDETLNRLEDIVTTVPYRTA